ALDGDDLMGIEIGFEGPGFEARKATLAPFWQAVLEEGVATHEELSALGKRVGLASWLNPVVPGNVYYIHAISVKEAYRGKKVGYALMQNAIEQARAGGYRGVQLDVLSDNPAVQFYRSMGFECRVESIAPIPHEHGVPMEMRMELRF
ncbi:MAG: GNAT family N-acetyltransferase, partial [Pseudomonadota bacterium]